MPTVRLDFSPAPAHVRTARLVAVAVARRAGVADELLDEIRLAVGEACSRAVALHQRHGLDELVQMEMSDGGRFTVRVCDRGPAEAPVQQATVPDPADLVADTADLGTTDVTVGMGLALLAGLVDDLDVAARTDGPGSTVSMSWVM